MIALVILVVDMGEDRSMSEIADSWIFYEQAVQERPNHKKANKHINTCLRLPFQAFSLGLYFEIYSVLYGYGRRPGNTAYGFGYKG